MTDILERVKTYQQFIGGEWVDCAVRRDARRREPGRRQGHRQGPGVATPRTSTAPSNAADDGLRDLAAHDARRARADAPQAGRRASRRGPTSSAGSSRGTPASRSAPRSTRSRSSSTTCASSPARARVMEGKAANEYMAGHTSMIRREPVGVVASIAPWNYPIMMAGWKIGPALAAGNTVVLKPSARTPLTALVLAEIAADILPAGVLNVITGTGATIGDPLVGHPKVGMISVTGDTDTGKHIARVAADKVKRLHLELGGKAPVIVFDDADLEAVIENLKTFGYWNAGQDCTAPCRVIAGPKIYDRFVADLADAVKTDQVGRPGRGRRHRDGLADRAGPGRQGRGDGRSGPQSGAEIVTGGHRPDRPGAYYEPTVIAGPGPAQRDRPGRGLRAGRQRPALQRRGAGHRLGERRPLRAGRVGLDDRRRQGDAGRQGDPVRDGLDQRPLHARVRDAPRRLQGIRLRQGPEHVRDRGLHGRQARDAQDLRKAERLSVARPRFDGLEVERVRGT